MKPHDDELLEQINQVLDEGKTSDHNIVNRLAKSQPQIDAAFQATLEARLMSKLQAQNALQPSTTTQEHNPMPAAATLNNPLQADLVLPRTIDRHRKTSNSYSFLTWAAAVTAVLMVSGLLFTLSSGGNLPSPTDNSSTAIAQTEETIQVVIATQEIAAGAVITEEQVGVVTLSAADMAKLRITQPEREFFRDTAQVVGQTAATTIFWFMPIDASLLGELLEPCATPGVCLDVPEGYRTLNLDADASVIQGLKIGDHIDVLSLAEHQMKVVVKDIILADILEDKGKITVAAPSWKQAVLIWLYQKEEPFFLRVSTLPQPEPDMTLVDYTFTAPEPLPEDYIFDMLIGLPVSKGYQLMDLPASIEHIQYTERDFRMQFWYTNIEMVKIDGAEVTIRLPKADADNLAFLLALPDIIVGFQPDADTYR